jgi:hypothetical protein
MLSRSLIPKIVQQAFADTNSLMIQRKYCDIKEKYLEGEGVGYVKLI